MKPLRTGLFVGLFLSFACSSSAPLRNPPEGTGGTGGEEMPPPAKDAAVDKASPPKPDAGGTGGEGGMGGSLVPDASVDAMGDSGGSPPDAGTQPDAFVQNMGGPFGLNTRPGPQTCKAFADPMMPAMKLSATGCADKADVKKPAASLIPYEVNSPLWSDGATKARYMAVPDGALIHVKDCMRDPTLCKPMAQGGTTPNDGHWDFPVGTVLVKHFSFNGKFLETRLYERLPDQWYGYSYAWNDAQTDADLVDEFGVHKMIAGLGGKMQDWFFPGRNDCNTCHNPTVGFTLGPETMQMNKAITYSGGLANQVSTLQHIGLFDAPVRMMNPLTDPATTTATLEARARSYLQANCATCHRPGGDYADVDMRFSTLIKDTGLCDVPNKGDLGVMDSKRMIPGMPSKSVMYLRMLALTKNTGRMPQLATSVIDPTGTKVISDWITALPKTTCP
jgi:hypothetical protein